MIGALLFLALLVGIGRTVWWGDLVGGAALIGGVAALFTGNWGVALTGLALLAWTVYSFSRA